MEPTETPPLEAPRSRGRLNSTIVATGAAVALTLAGLGIAGAQTGSSSSTSTPKPIASAQADRGHHHKVAEMGLATAAETIGISETDLRAALRSGQPIADVAKSKNVDVQKVIDALVAEAKKILAEKVAAGELTQAQADRRSATLTERITAFVNQDGHRPRGNHARGNGHHLGAKMSLAVAAETIGISEADLRAALRSGQSIADVAKSKNVEVQKVIDALVAEAEKNLAERITAFVNRAGPGPDREQRGGFRGFGAGGVAPAPAPAATTA